MKGRRTRQSDLRNNRYLFGLCFGLLQRILSNQASVIARKVTSGDGLIIVEKAKEVLVSEFPEYQNILIHMPDENSRRVGQSIAAASLPKA